MTATQESSIVIRQDPLVLGQNQGERDQFIQQAMEATRFYLEQPDAIFDFNAHKREVARKNWERKAEQARKRGQEVDPFDDSEFPPQLHIKANTWARLARRYNLDIQLVHHGWDSDPGWPDHKAYEVEAIVSVNDREIGRSRQMCSFAEQLGSRRRWNDTAQVMATAETRARSRAISQALQWAIPFAYHTSTPEEMPGDQGGESPEYYERPARQSVHPDIGANAPHLRGGENVNANFKRDMPGVDNPHAAPPAEATPESSAPQEPSPSSEQEFGPAANQEEAEAPAVAEEPAEIHWPMSHESWNAGDFTSEQNKRLAWAHSFYNNCIQAKLLPSLAPVQWKYVVETLFSAYDFSPIQQSKIVQRLRANPNPGAEDAIQAWEWALTVEENE